MPDPDATDRLIAALLDERRPSPATVSAGRTRLLHAATATPGHARLAQPNPAWPIRSRPARSRPAWSRPAWSRPAWSRPAWSRPAWSRPAWSRPAWSRVAVTALVAGLAAAVAATVVIVTGARPAAPHQPGASQPYLTAALRKAVLTSFDAAGGDVLRLEVVDTTLPTAAYPGHVFRSTGWTWPIVPRRGQQERWRMDTPGVVDWGATATNLAPALQGCDPAGAGSGRNVPGTITDVQFSAKTWSTWAVSTLDFGYAHVTDPACLRAMLASGDWRLTRTTWHGQGAIKLTSEFTRAAAAPSWLVPPPDKLILWLDSHTYLPLAAQVDDQESTDTLNFQELPPGPASLAQLNVPIPPGFRQVRGFANVMIMPANIEEYGF
jgi:hypothetical protein